MPQNWHFPRFPIVLVTIFWFPPFGGQEQFQELLVLMFRAFTAKTYFLAGCLDATVVDRLLDRD